MSTNDPLDGLGNLLGDVTGGAGSSGLPAGLGEVIGDQVQSWIGRGPNQPVTADEIAKALGPERVQQLAGSTGLDVGQLLPMLAAFLPQIINALTPNGRLPQPGEPGAAGGPVDALGGILKGLGG